jgi:TIR domain
MCGIFAVMLLMAYLLVNSSAAQMMPTPKPQINDSATIFALIGAAIIVVASVAVIFIFYSRSKKRTSSKSKFVPIIKRQPKQDLKTSYVDEDSRPFDVFLCYKKSSGKDYADHLKTGLEELGLHTFQDCQDIPLTVETEEGWAYSRDKALEESKYFVLIMTPGFDLSREVVNEISMARKQANKRFVFFRHRSMGRKIVLNLGDEILDIGKLEQVSFENKEELLRLAHNILLKTKTQ